ncbi:hypothetical protein NLJ89_g3378 [Agrocybe chaxingu]|uniref:Hydrophobin n=1 Tax=Agrocybe chaxingu TaxID=84603 RepID=A0A9W8K2K6_9AGAR|nr:hypothetical protein NLJ89_g3378 [Agrocybe chaxingu]
MKLRTLLVALFVFAAPMVDALPSAKSTNAGRLALGLPPLPPARRATHVAAARRSGVSPITQPQPEAPVCETGPIQCCKCQKVTTASDSVAGLILSLLGVVVKDPSTSVAMTCSPMSSTSPEACTTQTVCCENNSFNGLIALGCTPNSGLA